jgi:uncharacterized membrane protein YdjX (TVP38/TMEM64 family)
MRLVLWFLGFAGLCLGAWMLWGAALERALTGESGQALVKGPAAGFVGVALLWADLLLPIPSTVVMSALGWKYGAGIGGLLASLGSVLAGLTGYGLCRMIGETAARKLLGAKDYETGHRLFERGGGWIVALSRALPILPEALACVAGMVRMPFRSFFVALLCGSLPMGFLFAAIGAAGREAPAWTLGLNLVLPGILWFVARRFVRSGLAR